MSNRDEEDQECYLGRVTQFKKNLKNYPSMDK